jgi:eukaryotic-like serine/threonine-protein kinase
VADRVGQQLGNYRLIRLIGQGGFGEVYLGEHVYLKTQAAIKVLQMRLTNEDMESFLDEARTIARLEHPNIVRVLEFGVEDSTPFLVMSYAPNGVLRQRHPKGISLPLPTIVSYIKQVADALQYAHDEKLIHRDVKPENMLLGRRNEVLLSDFGIALVAQSSRYQSTQEVIGTVAYMAPEQLQGKPRPASDQYALGIIVYEWLTGDRPFHGTFTELYSQHLFVPPPPLREKAPDISLDVEQVVLTALAKDPQQRFKSVQVFATALEQACLPSQHSPVALQSQPLAPTVVATPPSQHVWPATVTSPSTQPLQLATMITPSSGSQSSKQGISRRTVALGLTALVAAGVVGSGLTWLALPHSSSAPTISTVNPVSTPTSTSLPIGTTFYTYRGHSSKIRVLAWSPSGKRIASGSDDYTVQVWDASTGGNALIYRGHSWYVEGVAWSPDSSRIASGSADTTVQIWNPNTGNLIYTYHGHSLWVNRVSWSPDGKYITSGEQSGSPGHVVEVRVWEADTGKTVATYRGHSNGVFAVAWSPDSTRVASCGYDGTLQIWDASSGNSIATYRGNAFLFGLSWSPDGKRIAVGGSTAMVWVLDASTGDVLYTYHGHTDYVGDVAWSPDEIYIASGSGDQTVQIFKATDGTNIYTYRGQSGHLDAVTWSPDGKRIASGSDSSTVQVWQAS